MDTIRVPEYRTIFAPFRLFYLILTPFRGTCDLSSLQSHHSAHCSIPLSRVPCYPATSPITTPMPPFQHPAVAALPTPAPALLLYWLHRHRHCVDVPAVVAMTAGAGAGQQRYQPTPSGQTSQSVTMTGRSRPIQAHPSTAHCDATDHRRNTAGHGSRLHRGYTSRAIEASQTASQKLAKQATEDNQPG